MSNREKTVLSKILQEIADIEQFAMGQTFDTFDHNVMLKKAVAMSIITIGELVKSVSGDLRARYPDVPWRNISGMRDIVAHKYETLRSKDVWKVVIDDLPQLKANILRILSEL